MNPQNEIREMADRLNLDPARLQAVLDERSAAIGLGFMAACFVLQPETWPVFGAWLRQTTGGAEVDFLDCPEVLPQLVEQLHEMRLSTDQIAVALQE